MSKENDEATVGAEAKRRDDAERWAERRRPFLYNGKGPWPQPNPRHPRGEAPVVLSIPKDQMRDFNRHVGFRYIRELLFGWPAAAWKAATAEVREYPSDAAFSKMMTTSIYSKLLSPLSGGQDEAPFRELIERGGGATFYKIDLSAMRHVEPYRDMHVAPTLSLVEERGSRREVVAIEVAGLLVEPADVNAWNLAKLFVLQGASYATLFTEHPNLHFPFDAINAITQTILPTDHVVFQLLYPHLRFQLALNDAVLGASSSVITDFRPTIYAPFTADASSGLLELFVAGYRGVTGRSGYPRYDFEARPKRPPSEYGTFLGAYYDTILDFTRVVADKVSPHDRLIRDWADYIVDWIPGFPGPDDIGKPGVLAETLARIVWDLTVGHGADHATFSYDVSPEMKFLRIRVAPPASRDIAPVDIRDATRWVDRFKMRLAHRMFFEPIGFTKLINTDYNFADPELAAAQNDFHAALYRTDSALPNESKYMKLADIPASIQF